MREDLKTFTLILCSLMMENRVNCYRMPVEHLNHFIEGLTKYKKMPNAC